MQNSPVTEGGSATLDLCGVCGLLVSELQSIDRQCDLGVGSSARSLGLFPHLNAGAVPQTFS